MDKIELIDRAAVRALAYVSSDWSHGAHPLVVELSDIDDLPAIDAAPVRRSEWVTDDDNNDDWAEPYCKKCGCSIPCGPAHFCPNCGADMRG